MTETLLQYLTRRNPTVIASGAGKSKFAYSEEWETVEDLEIWSEFNYETLTSRFGEELQREVPQFDATTIPEAGGYNRIYDERGLNDLVCMSIMGPVSAVLSPLFITSGGRTTESLGCFPDWGAGYEGRYNTNERAKALIVGDTKYNWSSASAISTLQNMVYDSYEHTPKHDDVRPIEQVMHYGSLYKCCYVFVITEKELVVMQLHLGHDPVRTSPRPVRTRPPTLHQRTASSSAISKQLSDISIKDSDFKLHIGLVKYKTIPWAARSGLTVKLALYCLIRLAHEDGSDLRLDYPPICPAPMARENPASR
ncbi:hypothetical protein BJX63DRAFT_422081 [Aspergillus granulosus]|uniref:Uncharacterized protein n=1 Tax=Aspergillus granulosus TaxID=176169 RepID=A0ABR4H9B9_9EURO